MKILYINSLVPNSGSNLYGALLHAYEYIKANKALMHSVQVFPDLDQKKTVSTIIYLLLKFVPTLEYIWKYYLNGLWEFVLFVITLMKTIDQYDFILARISLHNLILLNYLSRRKISYCLEINALLHIEKALSLSRIELDSVKKKELNIIVNAKAIFVVSEVLKEDVVKLGAKPDSVFVNPNGVDTDFFLPSLEPFPAKQKYNIQSDYIIGFLGNVKAAIDLEVVVSAIRILIERNQSVHLILAGKGSDSNEIKNLLMAKKIVNKATLIGFVSRKAAPHLIASFNITVSPLHKGYEYTSPLKELAYMAMEKPMVVSDASRLSPLLLKDRAGKVAKTENPESMADAIQHFIEHPEESKETGRRARKLVLSHYTWKQNANFIISTIKKIDGIDKNATQN